MPEIEDPVTTLARLLKSNTRLVNDDGTLANICISREWYDRELLKNCDAQVTVGLRQPSQVKPLNLSQSLFQRSVNLKVDCWVVDKAGKQPGTRTRSKLREEILRVIRQKRVAPNQTVYDYCGLGVSDQHDAYHAGSDVELVPSSTSWTELSEVEYQNLWYSDDARFSKTVNVNLQYAMMLFRFKIETSRCDPHENNVKQIVLSFEGYGTFPTGQGVVIKVWNHVAGAWQNPTVYSDPGETTVTITLTSNLTDYIQMDSSGAGYIYLLARTQNPSDGVTPAVLYCDYAKCVLIVEGLTHVKFGSYNDADDVSVKPFLWHSEFQVIGWMFENVLTT